MKNVLKVGPGTMWLRGGSELFFITSETHALSISLLHTFLSITSNYMHVCYVVDRHLVVSLIILLNVNQLYAATLLTNYFVTMPTGILAFKVASDSSS